MSIRSRGFVHFCAFVAAAGISPVAAQLNTIDQKPAFMWGGAASPIKAHGRYRTLPANRVPSGFTLAWQDDFVTPFAIDADPSRWSSYFRKWNVRFLAGNGDEGVKVHDDMIIASGRTAADALRSDGRWGSREHYLHEVSNGTLKLRAFPLAENMRSEFWGFPYVASMISGDRLPGDSYGYWEIRARINAIGKGQHLAFWLLPDDGSWPPEVDLLEVVGTNPKQYSANLHLPDGESAPPMTFYSEPKNTFHTIGFQWTPTLMRWTLDGKVVREHENYVIGRPFYILVSWEIGSYWPGKPDATTPWPAEAEIDYIRVYKPVQ